MNGWLDMNAEGIALMIVLGMIGLLFLLGAIFIERLVIPRHERLFDNMAKNTRGRRAMSREAK